MKVSLRKEDEKYGLLKNKIEYALYVKVQLSDDEVIALKQAGINNHILMEYSYKGTELNWLVSSVLYSHEKNKEWRFVAYDSIDRIAMEDKVKESLKALKSNIEAQMSRGGSGTESFEL